MRQAIGEKSQKERFLSKSVWRLRTRDQHYLLRRFGDSTPEALYTPGGRQKGVQGHENGQLLLVSSFDIANVNIKGNLELRMSEHLVAIWVHCRFGEIGPILVEETIPELISLDSSIQV